MFSSYSSPLFTSCYKNDAPLAESLMYPAPLLLDPHSQSALDQHLLALFFPPEKIAWNSADKVDYAPPTLCSSGCQLRSEERRVGKSVDLGGHRIIKKKKLF